MATCCSVLGLIFLVLTNLVIIVSFATPYWVDIAIRGNNGLWAFCVDESCTWIFEDTYKTTSTLSTDSAWWIATLGLTSSGLGISLFALLLATAALCCDCRGCNASHAIGGMLFTAFLALIAAGAVFGYCAHEYDDVQLKKEHDGVLGDLMLAAKFGKTFGWAYWLDIGAAGMALLTSIIFMIDGRKSASY